MASRSSQHPWPRRPPGAAASSPHTPRPRPGPDPALPPGLSGAEPASSLPRAWPAGHCAPDGGPRGHRRQLLSSRPDVRATRTRLARDLAGATRGTAAGVPGTPCHAPRASSGSQSSPSPTATPSSPERHLAMPPPASRPGSAPRAPALRLPPGPPRSHMSLPGRPRRQWLAHPPPGRPRFISAKSPPSPAHTHTPGQRAPWLPPFTEV